MTTADVFAKLAGHMIKGLMVHDQLANYYDFLGLDGFRREHRKHYDEESACYHELCHYYTRHYNMLVASEKVEDPKIIPQTWYKYLRTDVDVNTRRNGVENGFRQWRDWEATTLHTYEQFYKELFNLGEVAACHYLEKLIEDVNSELEYIDEMILKLKATDYDAVYICELQ